jgi:Ni,Fe-hydrogenase III large subunit
MSDTNVLLRFLRHYPQAGDHRPWARFIVDRTGWSGALEILAVSDWELLGFWAAKGEVHQALRDSDNGTVLVLSLPCPEGRYPAVSPFRPAALRLERMVREMWGLDAEGAEDRRLWLDHGRWGVGEPLGKRTPRTPEMFPYAFHPAEGEGIHQIPVGPVHAGIIEPGHFRFHANGEAVVRLEERLGYVHKGIEDLMTGRSPLEASKLAGRLSGDSTVAHALAFARAVEAAAGIEAPPRAHWLRALMCELERIANHLGDFGAVCNDAAFSIMLVHCLALKEQILRACQDVFGHRMMMDRVIPGGVAADLDKAGAERLRDLVRKVRPRFEELVRLYDDTPSLLDRTVGTGVVMATLAHRFGAGGVVGRASARGLDARRNPGYPPYDDLDFDIPVAAEGDVHARLEIRIAEIRSSLVLVERIADSLPGGPLARNLPARSGEGMALIEGFRGEILTWVRLDGAGQVARCFPRDPSWFQWPLLEAAIEGNIVADFPLCNKSFNCSYSGPDL